MRRSPHTVLTVATVLLLSGCGSGVFGGDPGPSRTEERTLAGEITTVELATSGAVTLTTGQPPSLRITAGENVLDHLTSEVHGGRLVLDDRHHGGNLGEVRYDLVLPSVRELQLSGSGTIDYRSPKGLERIGLSGSGEVVVGDLAGEVLTVELDGSGRVEIEGRVGRQTVSVDGSGVYQAGGLESQEAAVRIGGSGTADVLVRQTLDAVVEGSGSITYAGDPKVTERIDGSGSVGPR